MGKFKTLNNGVGYRFLHALAQSDERRICYQLYNYREQFIPEKYDIMCRVAFHYFPLMDSYVAFDDSVSCDVTLYIIQLWRSLRQTK